MKKSLITSLHLGFWSCLLLLIITILTAASQGQVSTPPLSYLIKLILGFVLIPSVISFYSFYLFLFPKYLKHKKVLLCIVYGLLLSIAAALIGSIILSAMFGVAFMFQDQYNSFFGELILMTLIGLVCGIIGLILKGFISWYEDLKIKKELIQKNHEMEMALIKSNLDPHFLFNTINNIDILMLKSPEIASNYLNKLSDILRFMLFETKTDFISLSEELAYIKKYIELQKIRTSNSNYVNLTISGNSEGVKIAPMVFISYVENAFKHTSNKKAANTIQIHIAIEKNKTIFKCENKFNPKEMSSDQNNSIGNTLIKKRLNLIYQDKHTLEVTTKNKLYSVSLSIDHG